MNEEAEKKEEADHPQYDQDGEYVVAHLSLTLP